VTSLRRRQHAPEEPRKVRATALKCCSGLAGQVAGEQVKAAGGFVGRSLGSVRIWRFAAVRNGLSRIRKQHLEPDYLQVSAPI